jgi:hypothetical protein
MADITSIPAARVPVLEPGTAIMSREWYRFLFNQFGQTGSGTTDISISDLSLAPFSGAEAEAMMDLVRADVQGLLSTPPITPVFRCAGGFASTAGQTVTGANTATAVTFNVTTAATGVSLDLNSRIYVSRAGAYFVSFTGAVDKTGGGADPEVYFWLRKSNVDIANTPVHWRVRGNDGEAALSLNATVLLAQNDYLEVMWASPNTNVTLTPAPATVFCAVGPSALLSIMQVDQ